MLEKLTGIVIFKSDQYIMLNFHDLILKIQIIKEDFAIYHVNMPITINTFFNLINFEMYGFYKEKSKKIFLDLLKINNIGVKTAYNIFSAFETCDLITLFQQYNLEIFVQKTKLKLSKVEEIFLFFNKKYFDTIFSNLEKKLIKVLLKLGYPLNNVYQIINLNKELTTKNYPFDYILQKLIFSLNNKLC